MVGFFLNGVIMFRKLIFTSLSIAISGTAIAGELGPVQTCAAGDVSVPCAAKGWDIGIQALYLKSALSRDRTIVDTAAGFREVDNDWGWGYKLEGSYHFNTGNDLSLNWTHYQKTSNFTDFVGVVVPLQTSLSYNLQNKNEFNQVNLIMGQHADFGLLKDIRFYGGLQYASINSDFTRNYELTPPVRFSGLTGVKEYTNSDFNGVGPTFGADFAYELNNNFSVTADSSGSILYGTARARRGFVFAPTG